MKKSSLPHNSGKEANAMKKRMTALLCMIAAGLVLSGCAAGNASGMTATAAPIVTNSPAAETTLAPTIAVSPSASPDRAMNATDRPMASMTPAQAGKLAENIAEAVERISEVDDAEVVISDDRVLVAVEFDDQYKAGLDERMKQMIEDAVRKVDDGLTDIEITDDDTLYGQVKGLGERLMKATGMDELADDFGDLWDRVTGM